MFDAKVLLNSILGGTPAAPAGEAVGGVVNQGSAALGSLGGMVAGALGKLEGQLGGTGLQGYAAQAGALAQQNSAATGAAVAGLAALLLGTSGGRGALGDAAKVGGLAALGGLAYQAFRNHQEGKPILAGVPMLQDLADKATAAFQPDTHDHDSSLLLLRTMVAAAAADGTVDQGEHDRIAAAIAQSGHGAEAAAFWAAELKQPATPAEIASAVGSSQELGVQAYMAARLATGAPNEAEKGFLSTLATALALPSALVAQIEGAASAHA